MSTGAIDEKKQSDDNTSSIDDKDATQRRIQQLESELERVKFENVELKSKLLAMSSTVTHQQHQQHQQRNEDNDDDDDKKCLRIIESVSDLAEWLQQQSKTQQQQQSQRQQQQTHLLSRHDIERYSRQLLLDQGFGVRGQLKLKQSKVLVIGAGGIGSTVLLYLAAFGIGHLGMVDFDVVEMSNLHRQIIHRNADANANNVVNKAVSACRAVLDLNPTIDCHALPLRFTAENAMQIIQLYDCVVDASDNPMTRYIINDACVLSGKPLISGSAVGTEGQLTVYNYKDGPCYRCLYPQPAVMNGSGCASCSDAGVLGPVPGLMGVLQSMEVIKVLTEIGSTMYDKMLLYDALACSFTRIKKPKKQINCPICSNNPKIRSMKESMENLQHARGPNNNNAIVCSYDPSVVKGISITTQQYKEQVVDANVPHVLLDVRVERQHEMCALPNAINIPLNQIMENMDRIQSLTDNGTKPIYCICRRGIASMAATEILLKEQQESSRKFKAVINIQGGLTAWQQQVDPSFPKY